MKSMSKRIEKNPRPNFVGSPKIEPQSSENRIKKGLFELHKKIIYTGSYIKIKGAIQFQRP